MILLLKIFFVHAGPVILEWTELQSTTFESFSKKKKKKLGQSWDREIRIMK